MANINFVPDDYIQNTESNRTNFLCVALLIVVMTGLCGSFATIKYRQKACANQEAMVNARMGKLQEAIRQFEDLQAKRKEMMKTALTTAELLEPIPRSVLLASLTNNLPAGTSLSDISMNQQPAKTDSGQGKGHSARKSDKESDEKNLQVAIEICGLAPSDLQVASYIERLANCVLLDYVALVESTEHKVKDTTYRMFKLTAVMLPDVQLTKEDVEQIRTQATRSIYNF